MVRDEGGMDKAGGSEVGQGASRSVFWIWRWQNLLMDWKQRMEAEAQESVGFELTSPWCSA